MLHHVVAGIQLIQVHHGHREPLAEQAGAHGGAATVDYIDQRSPLRARGRPEDLEVAEGELVHPHELGPVYAGDGADIAQAAVMRLLEIDEQRPGGTDAQRAGANGKSLQGLHSQLLLQLVLGSVLDEGPFVEGGDICLGAVLFPYGLLVSARDDELLGGEGREERTDIVGAALGHLECAGGHVQECRPAAVLMEIQPRQEVVLLLDKHLLAKGNSRGDYLRHSPLDYVLGKLGIFQLVADGYLVAGADKLRKVGVDGVIRHAGHGDSVLRSVGALGQHDAEDLAGYHGVLAVCLIEVPATEQQHGIGALGLEAEKLLHHRGHRILFLRLRHL